MLVLARKVGQQIVIGDNIEITVLEVRGEQVRLGITADRSISIHRKELLTPPPEAEETAAPVKPGAPEEPPAAAPETAAEPPVDAAPAAEETG
jgi:carbon storage regulator